MDVDVDEDVAMDMAMKWVEHLKWHKAIRGHLVPVSELRPNPCLPLSLSGHCQRTGAHSPSRLVGGILAEVFS